MADTDRVRRVRLTLFTLTEADRTVAAIRPELEALVHAKHDLDREQSRIEVLELAIAGATPDNPDARELETLNARRRTLRERLRRGVQSIQRHGCLVKDLERGLIDFYSLDGDRLIFLCWQLGEPEINHWHTLDGGFAARQSFVRGEADELGESNDAEDDHEDLG